MEDKLPASPKPIPPHLSRHRKVLSQLSLQPKVNHPALLQTRNSTNSLVTVKSPKNVMLQSDRSFAVKKFRMRSLLWVKPAGVAETSYSSTIAQLLPTLIVNIAALSSGVSLGFSAVTLPQLRVYANNTNHHPQPYQPFTVDEETGSWIASIFGLGAVLGGFLSAFLSSKFGRRRSILAMALPDLIGWILIATSKNIATMLVGRFMSGLATAGYSPAIQVYIAEIAQPQHRGWLGSLTMPVTALGTLIAYGMGSAVSWQYIAIFGASLPVILIPALSLIPDSPYWYLQNGDDKKALTVMGHFRSKEANGFAELIAISDASNPMTSSKKLNLKDGLQELTRRQYRRPFLILNSLFLVMFFSGNVTLSFYAVDIFRAATSRMDEYMSAVIVGVIRLLGTLLFVPVIKFTSRRLTLCISSLVMGISILVLAFVMYSRENGGQIRDTLDGLYWLPLLCVTIYILADAIGLGSIPYLYIGEFFPSELRSVLSGLTVGITNLEMFIVLKTFPMLCLKVGDSGAFWLYSAVCFAAIFVTLIFVPETKGKSLEDIEKYFGYKESLHVSPYLTPKMSPVLSPAYPRLSLQFTL